jgi:hypothetical protein
VYYFLEPFVLWENVYLSPVTTPAWCVVKIIKQILFTIVVAGFDRRRRLSSCRNGVPAPSQADPVEKLHPEEKAKGEGLPQCTLKASMLVNF